MAKESPISPWVRPVMIGWVAFMVFGVAMLAGMIDLFVPGAGERFGRTTMETLGLVPTWAGDVFQFIFGFYAVGKSGEKIVKHWREPDMPAEPTDHRDIGEDP